jgi:hypothetical protein
MNGQVVSGSRQYIVEGGDILVLYPIARRIPVTNSCSSSQSRAEILSLMNSLWGVIPFILDMKSIS